MSARARWRNLRRLVRAWITVAGREHNDRARGQVEALMLVLAYMDTADNLRKAAADGRRDDSA